MAYIPVNPVENYEKKEPTKVTANKIIEVFAESGLSVLECRGCLQLVNDSMESYAVIRKPRA